MDSRLFILLTVSLIPTMCGYFSRRMSFAGERLGKILMTLILVFGYSSVGFLSIWGMCLELSHMWLPTLAAVHVLTMFSLAALLGPLIFRNKGERGLFVLGSGLGNTGFTMGGFVVFQLFGSQGLALSSIFCLVWTPLTVLVTYPIARHFAAREPAMGLGRLMIRNLLDWRGLPLIATIAAMLLAYNCVPRPEWIGNFRIVDILMYVVTALAYFAIGLRLHFRTFWSLRKLLGCVLITRFPIALGLSVLLAWLTSFTASPLTGMAQSVFIILPFCPVAVTVVGVANMFGVKPREASSLFVVNSLFYLLVVLPFVLKYFG